MKLRILSLIYSSSSGRRYCYFFMLLFSFYMWLVVFAIFKFSNYGIFFLYIALCHQSMISSASLRLTQNHIISLYLFNIFRTMSLFYWQAIHLIITVYRLLTWLLQCWVAYANQMESDKSSQIWIKKSRNICCRLASPTMYITVELVYENMGISTIVIMTSTKNRMACTILKNIEVQVQIFLSSLNPVKMPKYMQMHANSTKATER